MNSINNVYQYNSKKIFKILIALFILLFVSYISVFKGIADISLKRSLKIYLLRILNPYHQEKW